MTIFSVIFSFNKKGKENNREDFKPKDKISNSLKELKTLALFEYNCKYVIYTQKFLDLVRGFTE